MNRVTWLIHFAIGLIAGCVTVLIRFQLLGTWLTVWPICWLAAWLGCRLSQKDFVVIGYYVTVGLRVILGLSLALTIDRLQSGEFGRDREFWFVWLGQYLICLVSETVLLIWQDRDLMHSGAKD